MDLDILIQTNELDLIDMYGTSHPTITVVNRTFKQNNVLDNYCYVTN